MSYASNLENSFQWNMMAELNAHARLSVIVIDFVHGIYVVFESCWPYSGFKQLLKWPSKVIWGHWRRYHLIYYLWLLINIPYIMLFRTYSKILVENHQCFLPHMFSSHINPIGISLRSSIIEFLCYHAVLVGMFRFNTCRHWRDRAYWTLSHSICHGMKLWKCINFANKVDKMAEAWIMKILTFSGNDIYRG